METFKILRIGCQRHDIAYWEKHYIEIANKHNADATIEEYYQYILLAKKLYIKEGSNVNE